jgi:single-strand DNA-binding protein
MINYIALSGILEHDPAADYCPNNYDQPQATFTLAFQTGNNRTGRIRVTCSNHLAEFAGRYLRQGTQVAVAGVLDQQQGESSDKQEMTSFRLIARSLELLGTDRRDNARITPLESRLPGQRVFGDMPGKGSD